MANTAADPWIDSDFGGVDFRAHRDDILEQYRALEDEHQTSLLLPEIVDLPPADEVLSTPEPVSAEPIPAPLAAETYSDEPEYMDLPDGGRVAIEKTKKGWCATLDSGSGGLEKFYGKTKNEMLQQVLVGKLNATKQIRDLTRKVKLGDGVEATATRAERSPEPVSRELTADEIFSIKTKLDTNPALAFEEWFQKRTGLGVEQLVQMASKGSKAGDELTIEAVNKAFISRCPDYYPDANFENFEALVAYLGKNKIGKILTLKNRDAVYQQLVNDGMWTVQNLEEAYTDLSDSGLLIEAPRTSRVPEPVVPVVEAPAPTPAVPDGRIVRTETRPRAGLGIRQSEVTQTRPADPKPPQVEDLNNLSDEEISQLWNATRRESIKARARTN